MSGEEQKLRELLRRVSLFEGLEEGDQEEIIPLFRRRKFVKNQPIVEVDTPGNSLYLIEQGELKVTLSKGDREVILSLLKEGEFFGEMSLLDRKPRSANVIALKNSRLYELNREDFHTFIESHPKALLKILEKLSERLRQADEIIGDLTLLDVYGRVASLLLKLAQDEGETTEQGTLIRRPPSQQQIAGMLGASRETVNRVISDFVKRGIVRKEGRQLYLTYAELLAELD